MIKLSNTIDCTPIDCNAKHCGTKKCRIERLNGWNKPFLQPVAYENVSLR